MGTVIDVLAEFKAGGGRYEWHEVRREHAGKVLYVSVFRDAMKFDDVPRLDWSGRVVDSTTRWDGVRLPATPEQLQNIADHLDAMLLTPVIIEEIWIQAQLRFNAIVNNGPPKYTRVADLGITDIHRLIQRAINELGGDNGTALVDSVGKYWCLINGLGVEPGRNLFGLRTACNFGWCSTEGSGLGVTPRVRCWQRPGFKHATNHHDPSQTIRLMSKHGRLIVPGGLESRVYLPDIARDPDLAPLLHHERGTLTCLRQPGVTELPIGGTVDLPPLIIEATPDVS